MTDPPSPTRSSVVVVGRYEGTVVVLADMLRLAGAAVTATAALDAVGTAGVTAVIDALPAGAVVVFTLSPDDRTAAIVLDRVRPDHVVAVTWHPVDERPPVPGDVATVAAGRIRADLVRIVAATSGRPTAQG